MAGKPYVPYDLNQVRQMADDLGIDVDVQTAAVASDDPEGFGERPMEGRPQILLIKSEPSFGHFILLMGRHVDEATGVPTDIELFDSQATKARTLPGYLMGTEEGSQLNGHPPDWLGRVLMGLKQAHGITLSFNYSPYQALDTNTCALQVLARAATPDVPPAEFTKQAFEYFSK